MKTRTFDRSTLVDQVASEIRLRLGEGQWKAALPSERTLSAELRVSRETLRKALNVLKHEGLLTGEHRSQWVVLKPSHRRHLEARTVAILSPITIEQWESRSIIRIDRLRTYLASEGVELVFKSGRRFFAPNHHTALSRLVSKTNAACWILGAAPAEMQRWFAENRVPCLVAGPGFDGIDLPSIDLDFRSIAAHAAGLLLARGHRRIALVVKEPMSAGDNHSRQGFVEAMARTRGGDAEPVFIQHDGTVAGVQRAVDRAFRAERPPTAFIAPSKWVLVSVLYLAQHGILAGKRYAFVSRDDDPLLDLVWPTVARYGFNQVNFARKFFAATMRIVNQRHNPERHVRLLPKFVPGRSLDCEGFGKRV